VSERERTRSTEDFLSRIARQLAKRLTDIDRRSVGSFRVGDDERTTHVDSSNVDDWILSTDDSSENSDEIEPRRCVD